jgi:hypothetical protein
MLFGEPETSTFLATKTTFFTHQNQVVSLLRKPLVSLERKSVVSLKRKLVVNFAVFSNYR